MSLIVPLLHLLNTYQLNSFKKKYISVKKLGPRGGIENCIREDLSRRLRKFRTPTLLLQGALLLVIQHPTQESWTLCICIVVFHIRC